MTSHSRWNTVQPTMILSDGRCCQVPDHIAFNWMHSGSACAHIKYCFCVHPDLFEAVDDHWQYDGYWHQWIDPAKTGEATIPDWGKAYVVLTISRQKLLSLGLRKEQIDLLTDEDMTRIAYALENKCLDLGFEDDVKFIVSLELVEKGWKDEEPLRETGNS